MLYLASKSPRRRQLLEQIGIRFDVLDVDVPEIRRIDEPAEDYVSRVAREKAGAGLLQVAAAAGAVARRRLSGHAAVSGCGAIGLMHRDN